MPRVLQDPSVGSFPKYWEKVGCGQPKLHAPTQSPQMLFGADISVLPSGGKNPKKKGKGKGIWFPDISKMLQKRMMPELKEMLYDIGISIFVLIFCLTI